MKELTILSLLILNCLAFYPKNGNVVDLTPTNFDEHVIQGDEVWVVEFYAPWCGHCKNLVPEYTKLANALKGIIKVGAVNADQFKDLARTYNVPGYPTIYIFGPNKKQPISYDGKRTAKNIAEIALKAVKDKVNKGITGELKFSESSDKEELYENSTNIVELTDATFNSTVLESDDLWLVNFHADWCTYCKDFAPLWVNIAAALEGKIKLGVLNASLHKETANRYKVKKYPDIKFFSKVMKSPVDYNREHSSDVLIQWVLEKMPGFIPNPEIIQIVGGKTFKMICEEKALCIFTVLPHILDCQAECRNGYLKILKKLAEKFKQHFWGWGWSEGGSQPLLENALDIGGSGYPALAVINNKKLKYSIFKGAFTEKQLYVFLRDLAYGKGESNFFKNPEMPNIIEVGKWDGKDLPQTVEETDTKEILEKDEL